MRESTQERNYSEDMNQEKYDEERGSKGHEDVREIRIERRTRKKTVMEVNMITEEEKEGEGMWSNIKKEVEEEEKKEGRIMRISQNEN